MRNLALGFVIIILSNIYGCIMTEPEESSILFVTVANDSGGDVVIITYVDQYNIIQIDSASSLESGFMSDQLYGEAMLAQLQIGFDSFLAESDSNYISVFFNDTLKIDHYKIPRSANFEGDSSKIFLGESRNLFTEDNYEIEEINYYSYSATYTITVADYEYALEVYE